MKDRTAKSKDNVMPNAQQLQSVMQRTIELVGQKLKAEQIREIAKVFPTLCWNFKDCALEVYILLEEKGNLTYTPDSVGAHGASITMDTATLHNSAYGKALFGRAFITGKLKIKGVPALKLTKFMPLLNPFLESYKEAWEAYNE